MNILGVNVIWLKEQLVNNDTKNIEIDELASNSELNSYIVWEINKVNKTKKLKEIINFNKKDIIDIIK